MKRFFIGALGVWILGLSPSISALVGVTFSGDSPDTFTYFYGVLLSTVVLLIHWSIGITLITCAFKHLP